MQTKVITRVPPCECAGNKQSYKRPQGHPTTYINATGNAGKFKDMQNETGLLVHTFIHPNAINSNHLIMQAFACLYYTTSWSGSITFTNSIVHTIWRGKNPPFVGG
jgi:hypothetical protein